MEAQDLREFVLRDVQKCLETNPLIVLGTGFSMRYGIPGMWDLAQHLCESVNEESNPELWNRFKSELQASDLETALLNVKLTTELEDQVISRTWELIAAADRETLEAVRKRRCHVALTRVVKQLFNTSHRRIDVVTTNYDRLTEYAVAAAGHRCYTGFSGGYIQDWRPKHEVLYTRDPGSKGEEVRCVRVWKVHGSLDWFLHEDSPECWPNVTQLSPGMVPLIVTPGTTKYERTHEDPFRSVMQSMDTAISKARTVLAVGFGFNDRHVQARLRKRCHQDRLRILVVTKKLTEGAKEFLLGGKCAEFLALEECGDGTRCYSNEFQDGVCLPGERFWDLPSLVEAAI